MHKIILIYTLSVLFENMISIHSNLAIVAIVGRMVGHFSGIPSRVISSGTHVTSKILRKPAMICFQILNM
jgi:hypothetical protein